MVEAESKNMLQRFKSADPADWFLRGLLYGANILVAVLFVAAGVLSIIGGSAIPGLLCFLIAAVINLKCAVMSATDRVIRNVAEIADIVSQPREPEEPAVPVPPPAPSHLDREDIVRPLEQLKVAPPRWSKPVQ